VSIKICPKFHKIAKTIIDKEGKKQKLIIRLGCKQWQCPVCYKRNRDLWRHHLMKKISELGGLWSFWTITMPKFIHKASTPEKRAKLSLFRIQSNWDKFMKFMKRRFGKFEYVRVFETHESGAMHIHFIASFHVAEWDLKTVTKGEKKEYSYCESIKDEIFTRYNFGYMHSCDNLPENDFAKTVGYVTKYMTKEDDFVSKYLSGLRVRRIQTSRKIGAVPKQKSENDWEIVAGIHITEFRDMPIIDLNKGRKVVIEDFRDEQHYPTFAEIFSENQKAT